LCSVIAGHFKEEPVAWGYFVSLLYCIKQKFFDMPHEFGSADISALGENLKTASKYVALFA
jgi:hypothetical protein